MGKSYKLHATILVVIGIAIFVAITSFASYDYTPKKNTHIYVCEGYERHTSNCKEIVIDEFGNEIVYERNY